MRLLQTGLVCVLALGFVSACKLGTTELKARRNVRGDGNGTAHGSISIPTEGGGGSGPGSLAPAGPDAPGSDNPPVATGDYKIGSNGLLTGKNVHHYIGGGTLSKYTGGSPKGIILHKTAGPGCNDNNTSVNQKPHIYVCRDGRVIVNGSFDKPREAAEKYHNDWSLNIEIEASDNDKGCDRRGEMTWGQTKPNHSGGWRGKCYQEMTDAQVAAVRPILAALSKRYNIPLKPAIDVKTQREYVSKQTNILLEGRYGPRSYNPSNMPKGILPSFWTARDKPNLDGAYGGNHDDGASWNDMKRLGLVPGNAP